MFVRQIVTETTEQWKIDPMARKCDICGKSPSAGNTVAKRGKAKREGGVGIKQTGVTKRRFKPNIQKIWADVEGKKKKIKVCSKCIKSGHVAKPRAG